MIKKYLKITNDPLSESALNNLPFDGILKKMSNLNSTLNKGKNTFALLACQFLRLTLGVSSRLGSSRWGSSFSSFS
jgi:hypothetical protein